MATKKATSTTAKKSTKSASTDSETPKPQTKSTTAKAPAKSADKKAAATTDANIAPKRYASHEEIAAHAHKLWQQSGHHHGSHVDHWLRAEKELNG